jgi:hypothetical protein
MPSRLRSLLLSALVLCACQHAHAEWHNALKPKGALAGDLQVTKSGKPLCKIAVANASAPIENSAARELQHWLREISGATPEIAQNADGPAIVIRTEPVLGEEGYRIAFEGDDLILAGGAGRGCLNAVFALLEEDLGCRFYTNESIKLPKTDSLTIQPVARQYKPQLRLRDPFYKCAFDATWSLRNRTNCPEGPVPEEQGGYVDYDGMFVHTFAALVPVDKYFKDHPEYFYLNNKGQRAPQQLCTTDPNVLKIATEAVLEQLRKSPHTEIVSVSKNDSAGNQLCQCERCKKLRDAEGAEMACQLVLVNGVAEAVEKEFPNVTIDTLAYLDTIAVPKTMRPRHNVAIRLCNDTVGAWSQPFEPAEKLPVAKIAEAWSAAHDRIYIWDYNVNFSHFLAPMPNLDVIAANIRFWAKHKAEGVMLQGGYQGPADGDELKSWVAAKLLWDPSRDEQALAADFIEGHYGAAAPAMLEYQKLFELLRTKYADAMKSPPGGIRYPIEVPFLPKDFIDEASKLFDKAMQAAGSDAALLRRIERTELPILYVKGCRGPEFTGPSYAQVVADFERIGRREGLDYIGEWGKRLDPLLAEWKQKAGGK